MFVFREQTLESDPIASRRRLSEHGKQRALRFTAAVRLWEPFKCRRENNREIIQTHIRIDIREPENAGGFYRFLNLQCINIGETTTVSLVSKQE